MVFELMFLVLDVLVPNPVSVTYEDEMVCDDGSSAWASSGEPNWACTRKGCTPHEEACWEGRLDHCFGDDGSDLGACVYSRKDCDTRLSCFELWFYCAGVYTCHEDAGIGCTRGTCTEVKSDATLDLVYDDEVAVPEPLCTLGPV
jgi:hypothetical protein